MAAPRIMIEFLDGFDDSGQYGIEMDIADKGREVIVFIAENGLVTVRFYVNGFRLSSVLH